MKSTARKPFFDVDFKNVSKEHYITLKSSLNFPLSKDTGDWHYLNFFDADHDNYKIYLAGIHSPDTSKLLGDTGVIDAAELFKKQRIKTGLKHVYIADHYRAAADMVIKWAMTKAPESSLEFDGWFPSLKDKKKVIDLIEQAAKKLERGDAWTRMQSCLRQLQGTVRREREQSISP
ncbi:hypothetical protein ACYPKM_04640 [Pseudomonas aeruginosa]